MKQDFTQIMQDYGVVLGRVAASYEANLHLRQELLQEISIAVWQSLSGFKGDSSIKTYILRVAHNRAISHVAYQVKQAKSTDYFDAQDNIVCNAATSEQQLHQQQQLNILLYEVRKLPIQTRQVVTLSMEGLSYQEIAEICGIQVSHVGAILSRSRKVLLEAMSDVR